MEGHIDLPPEDLVQLTYKKWPDTLHWSVDTKRLAETPAGVWVGSKRGTPIRQDREPMFTSGNSAVLFAQGRPWSPRWYSQRERSGRAASFSCYVDIITPPALGQHHIETVDLDLDVALTWDGQLVLLDEDEFEARTSALNYPENLVTTAREAAAEVLKLMQQGAPPFDGSHLAIADAWFAEVGHE